MQNVVIQFKFKFFLLSNFYYSISFLQSLNDILIKSYNFKII